MLHITLSIENKEPNIFCLSLQVTKGDSDKEVYFYSDSQSNGIHQFTFSKIYTIYSFSGSNGGNGSTLRSHIRNIQDLTIAISILDNKLISLSMKNYPFELPSKNKMKIILHEYILDW